MKLKFSEKEKIDILNLHNKNISSFNNKISLKEEIKKISRLSNFLISENKLRKLLTEDTVTVIAPTVTSQESNFLSLIFGDQSGSGIQMYTTIKTTLDEKKIFFTIDNNSIAQIITMGIIRSYAGKDISKTKKWDKNSETLLTNARDFISENFSTDNLQEEIVTATFSETKTNEIKCDTTAVGNTLEYVGCADQETASLIQLCKLVNTYNLYNNKLINPNGSGNVYETPSVVAKKEENQGCLLLNDALGSSSNFVFYGIKNSSQQGSTNTSKTKLEYKINQVGNYFEIVADGVGIENSPNLNEDKLKNLMSFIKKLEQVSDFGPVEIFSTTTINEKLQFPYKTEDEYYESLNNFPDMSSTLVKGKQYPPPQYFSATSVNGTIITEKNAMNSYNGFFAYKRGEKFDSALQYQIETKGFVTDKYPVGTIILRFDSTIKSTGQKDLNSLNSALMQLSGGGSTESLNIFEVYTVSI